MKNRSVLFILWLMRLAPAVYSQTAYTAITGYAPYYGVAKRGPTSWIVMRRFANAGRTYYLLADPATLDTRVDEARYYAVQETGLNKLRTQLGGTPYAKALAKAENNSGVIQDAGIERGLPRETGISLTADLCPSHRPLDRQIFTALFAEFGKVEQPVPVALSVTGIWMRQHPQDLAWLKQLQQQRQVDITWINHSFNHRVSSSEPLKLNFLLEPGTDITYEVLETEKAMLRNGLLPSVFFRFPGLVSDQQLVYRITGFGLIPIGTDSWLAKGQQPANGSIVLIHGNGNEPVGVADFIKLLRNESKAITRKQWLLYDLRQTVEGEADGSR